MPTADDTVDAAINTSTTAAGAAATIAAANVIGPAADHLRSQHGSAAGHDPAAAPPGLNVHIGHTGQDARAREPATSAIIVPAPGAQGLIPLAPRP